MSTVFVQAAEVITIVGGAFFVYGLVKKAFAHQTASISKVTDDGEQIAFSTNFSIWDSAATKAKKMKELHDIADGRRAFVHERFLAKLDEERAKQAEAQPNLRKV